MEKAIHTIVLDAGPIISNEPSVSTLISQAEELVTTPDIISEIKDANTRARITNTLIPFLKLRNPSPSSLKFAKEFARKTGDLPSLSNPDIQIIALTYELECERNGGDWRLKTVPGQKTTNGPSPGKIKIQKGYDDIGSTSRPKDHQIAQLKETGETTNRTCLPSSNSTFEQGVSKADCDCDRSIETVNENSYSCISKAGSDTHKTSLRSRTPPAKRTAFSKEQSISEQIARLKFEEDEQEAPVVDSGTPQIPQSPPSDSEADSDGWITPFNIKKWQESSISSTPASAEQKSTVQVAAITTDYAIQNVLLQINLNLLSPSLQRVNYVKNFVLRCHACFSITKDMDKQFCPRCGLPSLTKVSCSTTQRSGFKLHLKKNMQWNTRGDRFSIPKPVSGSASGRVRVSGKGREGGKGGWGRGLILAEDQKEYTRAVQQRKRKERNLMDDDFLPSILSGERSRPGGRPKIGAGRNVNSRKRH